MNSLLSVFFSSDINNNQKGKHCDGVLFYFSLTTLIVTKYFSLKSGQWFYETCLAEEQKDVRRTHLPTYLPTTLFRFPIHLLVLIMRYNRSKPFDILVTIYNCDLGGLHFTKCNPHWAICPCQGKASRGYSSALYIDIHIYTHILPCMDALALARFHRWNSHFNVKLQLVFYYVYIAFARPV